MSVEINGLWRGMLDNECLCVVAGELTIHRTAVVSTQITVRVVTGELEGGMYLQSVMPKRPVVLKVVEFKCAVLPDKFRVRVRTVLLENENDWTVEHAMEAEKGYMPVSLKVKC